MKYRRYPTLADLGLQPRLGHNLEDLFSWLADERLIDQADIFDRMPGSSIRSDAVAMAMATGRQQVHALNQAELKALRDRHTGDVPQVSSEDLWRALRDADLIDRQLQWTRIPADAMAFYRPFHFPPFDQWGIYLLVGPLLDYHDRLVWLNKDLRIFSPEILMHLVLFEVFNHEFFHHLVESTATTIEVLLAAQGRPRQVYLEHFRQDYDHPHAPLEEALANAYAYNALSFICRMKLGFRTASVQAYQKAIATHWRMEPPGYCDAGFYIGRDYVAGGARLLAQMLGDPQAADRVPLGIVAKHVMPHGFTALKAKPDIPTWLVGDPYELAKFNQLVPAPNEAYTQLFWPYDTARLDLYIEGQAAAEKAAKAAQKAARNHHRQQQLTFDL